MIMSGRQNQAVNRRKYAIGNNFSKKWRSYSWLGYADGNAEELLGRPPERET